MNTLRSHAKTIAVVVITIFALSLVAENAFARGGFRGGGFRSIGSSRSFRSFGSTGRASSSLFGWGSATRRTTTGTRAPISGTRSGLSSQRSLYTTAQRNGTAFSSREAAATSFRSQYGSQYTSRFASEPSARPNYIPQTTSVGGRTVNVVYNAGLGGYGYFDPGLGHWVLYNALADAVMMNTLMAAHSYWWGPAPMYVAGGPGFFTWAIILFIAFIVISSVMRAFRRGTYRQ